MMLSIFIHYATTQSIEKICRVLCPAMIILSVSPLIDLLFFFTYFLVKQYSLPRSVIFACGCYVLIYMWSMSPYINTAALAALGFFVTLWFAYLINTSVFYSISRNIQTAKIMYYLLTLIFGASLAIASESVNLQTFIYMQQTAVMNIIFSMMSVFYAVLFSSLIEMISDSGNDEYSVAADVNVSALKYLALTTLALGLFYASYVNAKCFLLIASIAGIFFIYDALPFQLKRIPVVSKLAVSANSLILILLGFAVVRQVTVSFPLHLIWIYLIGVTFAASSDLFMRLLGKKKAGIITGVIAFFVCLSFYFVLKEIRMLPVLAAAGILFFYLNNQSGNNKGKRMLACNAGLLAMSIYLVW